MFQSLLGKAFQAPAANDPYSLVPTVPNVTGGATCNNFPDWANPSGKVPVDVSTLANPIVGILCGQSLATNCINGTYTPTGGTAYNFSITNGGTYQATDPLLGCTGWHNLPSNPWPTGCWFTQLPDAIKARGITRPVILVPIGVGGSNVYDWQNPSVGIGGGNFPRLGVAARRLAAAGLIPSFVYWQQGESNNGSTTQAQYTAALASVISGIRAQWATVPILIAVSTYINDTTDANVAAAQVAAVNNSAGIYAGANGDTLTFAGGYRQTDKTHWNPTGRSAYVSLADTALHNAGIY